MSAIQKGGNIYQNENYQPIFTEKVRFRSLDLSPSALSKVTGNLKVKGNTPHHNSKLRPLGAYTATVETLSGYESPNTFSQ